MHEYVVVSVVGPKWCLFLAWAGVIFHVQLAELITNYALLLSACLKAFAAVQNFLGGFMKTVLALSQMSSYKLLWRQDVFYLIIFLPFGVFDVGFFHTCHSPNFSSLFFF